jgi:hypothetical protein
MEPITLILGALAAGAVAATQETAGQMIKDAISAGKFREELHELSASHSGGKIGW